MAKPSNLRIEDVGASTARGDLNDILISLASLQTTDGAGTAYTGEPTTTYPNMLWYDKATSILKVRSTDDSTWLNVAYIDQSANAYRIIDDTQVVNTSGTQTGLVGDQATATWEAGVGTVESLVSPAKVAAAITALVPEGIGDGQTWQNFTGSRTVGTSYQNTTGKPIMIGVYSLVSGNPSFGQVSVNNSTWVDTCWVRGENDQKTSASFIVPNSHYYRFFGGVTPSYWAELR